jgi:archaemetzincin
MEQEGVTPVSVAAASESRESSAHSTEPKPAESQAPQTQAPERAALRGKVLLLPLRSFPDELIVAVEDGLREEFDVETERLDPVPLPASAYYEPRRRYRADELLVFLKGLVEDEGPGTKILGMTEVDISTTKGPYYDWGIFGYAEMPGQAAVISSKRLRRRARDAEHVRFRVTTTAIHEIGHTFGLPHCREKRCVMQDAEGSIKNTDSSTGHLGAGCRAKLPPGPR